MHRYSDDILTSGFTKPPRKCVLGALKKSAAAIWTQHRRPEFKFKARRTHRRNNVINKMTKRRLDNNALRRPSRRLIENMDDCIRLLPMAFDHFGLSSSRQVRKAKEQLSARLFGFSIRPASSKGQQRSSESPASQRGVLLNRIKKLFLILSQLFGNQERHLIFI